MRRSIFLLLFVLVAGCSTMMISKLDELYGPSNPARFDQPTSSGTLSYQQDIKPILDNRCVVCHACYDAPCQLKLGSYAGLTRGSNKLYIYETDRLLATKPTRLFEDAQSNAEWRARDFYPVLNERSNLPTANIEGGVMAQMLLQKQEFPLPDVKILPSSFDFNLHRDQQCPDLKQYAHYSTKYPLWGMPYGLPAVSDEEHKTLMSWLSQGAPGSDNKTLSEEQQQLIKKWEAFFNKDSLQGQLVSRYMYEHLYLASLYFTQQKSMTYFQLVRSSTPPGQPVERIATRRPYDDPGIDRVYYRLVKQLETPVIKTHMPYRLDQERMQKWTQWFYAKDLGIKSLPDYELKTASNPFITFYDLPLDSRYRFMLEEAQYTIMGFIKGPVCRGQMALNVINDHFWVTFLDPEYQSIELDNDFLLKHAKELQLPASDSSSAGVLNWLSYGDQEKEFFKAKIDYVNSKLGKDTLKIGLDMMWDGEGKNKNAALTVFRHGDSASVIKGLIGDHPQSAWVITYPLLERIHYLLVAGYDVYGNIGHQLNSRIYMDFLRMEGEFNFLTLLPRGTRLATREHWYRGSVNSVKEYVFDDAISFQGETTVEYETDAPLPELYEKIWQYLNPVLDTSYSLTQSFHSESVQNALDTLDQFQGASASLMPQFTALEIIPEEGDSHVYSILSDTAYSNISYIFDESDRHQPEEDRLTVTYGIFAAYPNAFFRVPEADVGKFSRMVTELSSPEDYRFLLDEYGVRRSARDFWQFSDHLHQKLRKQWPIEFGLLDYNRLDNL